MAPSKQRGNHEGSVYEEGARSGKPTGRWIAQVWINGKKRRAVASTQAKAKQRLRKMMNDLDSGRLLSDGNLTVDQLLEQWTAKALPNRNLQEPTLEVHRWACTVLRAEIGGKRVKTLTPDHIEAAFQRRSDAGLSRHSLVKRRSTLSQALAWAERRGLVAKNVAAIVELPANARAPQSGRAMTVSQAHAFLAAAEGTPLGTMWAAMLYLGLRPGEAAALSWSDIDFTGNVVHVRRGRKRHRGRISIGSTKTPGSVRALDSPAKLIELFRDQRVEQKRMRLATSSTWRNDEDLVFTNPAGSPTDPPKVRAEFKRVIDIAEIGEGWTPNMLRHSAASIMSDAGVPLERIADQLGHKDTRMLTAHYRQRIRPTIDAALILEDVL